MQATGAQRAFVLRSVIYKESDLLISMLSSNGSLMTALARGAKNSKKRFGGAVLEPLNYIQYHLKPSKASDRLELAEASLLDSFDLLRKDYDSLMLSLKCASLVLFISQEGLEDKGIFHLFGNTLKCLESSTAESENIYWHFVCRLLTMMGDLEPNEVLSDLLAKPMGAFDYKSISSKQWTAIVNLLNTNFQSNYNRDLKDF